MEYDNPAARLLSILQAGREIDDKIQCRVAWDKLLRADGSNSILMSRLGKAMELPQDITQAIMDYCPSKIESTRYWFGQIDAAFGNQILNGHWSSFKGHIDDHTLNYLGLTAELLQSRANTKPIADEAITGLRGKFNEIYTEVLTANISIEIKGHLLRHLRQIIESIDEYFISGALPMLDASSALLGHAFVDKQYRSFLCDEELGTRIFESLTTMANIVTVSVGLPQLAQLLTLLPA